MHGVLLSVSRQLSDLFHHVANKQDRGIIAAIFEVEKGNSG